jgi:hypothetical protein
MPFFACSLGADPPSLLIRQARTRGKRPKIERQKKGRRSDCRVEVERLFARVFEIWGGLLGSKGVIDKGRIFFWLTVESFQAPVVVSPRFASSSWTTRAVPSSVTSRALVRTPRLSWHEMMRESLASIRKAPPQKLTINNSPRGRHPVPARVRTRGPPPAISAFYLEGCGDVGTTYDEDRRLRRLPPRPPLPPPFLGLGRPWYQARKGKNERENGGAVKLWDESLGGCLLMA